VKSKTQVRAKSKKQKINEKQKIEVGRESQPRTISEK
jgi:hypothetical protein